MVRFLLAVFAVLFIFEARAFALTCPQTIHSQITAADPKQSGRLNRSGTATTCASSTTVPTVVGAGTDRAYEAHTFKNRTNGTCISVTLSSNDDVAAAAYAGSFVPSNVQTNYLADSGDRPTAGNPKTFSFNVAPLEDFVVVVAEGNNGGGGNYQLQVTGCGEVLVSIVTPSFGPIAGNTSVTIRGAGFLSTPTVPVVRFGGQGGTQASNVVVFDEFTLTATTPAHAVGPVDVYVRNQNNSNGTLANGFTYYDSLPTTTTLTSSKSPTVYGEAVTYTAQIVPTAPTAATGSVQFLTGNLIFATVNVDATGKATYTTGALFPGTHSLTARYLGSPTHSASTSNTLVQVINKADTAASLLSSANPSIVGQAVTFTTTVEPVAPGLGIPSGNVTFFEGANELGTVALDANGQASFTTSTLATGTHAIKVEYAGDTNFNGTTSATVNQVVNVSGTTVALASSLNPSSRGANITFTATVSSNGGSPSVSGTITFADNGVAMGNPVPLAANQATLTTTTLTVGTHAITAMYSGDAQNAPATGSVSQVVEGAATTTTLTSSANPSTANQNVSFVATVTSAFAGTITGNVAFKDGATTIGTAVLTNGSATFSTSALTVGTHPITAVYEGAGDYETSTSAVLNQVVNGAATGDAGVSVDSGAPDATTPDATAPGVDASLPDASIPTIPQIPEGGGCDCRSSSISDTGAPLGLATLGVVVLGFMRRRRRN